MQIDARRVHKPEKPTGPPPAVAEKSAGGFVKVARGSSQPQPQLLGPERITLRGPLNEMTRFLTAANFRPMSWGRWRRFQIATLVPKEKDFRPPVGVRIFRRLDPLFLFVRFHVFGFSMGLIAGALASAWLIETFFGWF